MGAANNLDFVRRIVANLEGAGIVTWLFGGWAEELLELSLPRAHHDVDLLYPARDFGSVDAFLATGMVEEISAKRFPHKRAFETDGIMTELLLVQGVPGKHYTDFWGTARHTWPANLLDARARGMRVASTTALLDFRMGWANRLPSFDGRPVSAEEWLQHQSSDRSGRR